MGIFPPGFESAFLRVFLMHIKSGLNNPLAMTGAQGGRRTDSHSGRVQGLLGSHG